jgi:small nuclear ribonucleoprotein (snRNP)-like protein
MNDDSRDSALESLVGREVVIDVAPRYVYLGKLTGYDRSYVIIEKADVHDLRDTATTRENYIVEARRTGIHPNRDKVYVRIGEIVSVSALEDVMV